MMDDQGQNNHTYPLCCKNIYEPCSLKEHMLIHTGDKLHSCVSCGKSLTLKSDFTTHICIHSEANISNRCIICNKSFATNGSLTNHMLIHSEDKPNNCDVCGKSFTRSSLTRHICLFILDINLLHVAFVKNHLHRKRISLAIC